MGHNYNPTIVITKVGVWDIECDDRYDSLSISNHSPTKKYDDIILASACLVDITIYRISHFSHNPAACFELMDRSLKAFQMNNKQ
jgi:hypothetical protein